MRGDARHARNDEQRVGDARRDADVAAHGGDGAVDVDRQRALGRRCSCRATSLDRADHLDVLGLRPRAPAPSETAARRAGRACGSGGRSRAAVRPVSRHLLDAAVRRPRGTTRPCAPARGRYRGTACSSRCRRRDSGRSPARPAATHARSGAPVVAVLRAASVDGGVAPWSMNDTRIASISRPMPGDGTLAHEQQVDRLAERQPAHDLVERIAAHEDLVRLDAGQRRAPFLVRSVARVRGRAASATLVGCHGRHPLI